MTASPFRRGVVQGLPFVLIIVPFGALFGIVASEAGLDLAQVMGFSSLVIAGASQLVALQLMVDGVPGAIVVLSALAVNLRMAMYSAALAPHLGPAPAWQRAALAYLLVDQVYALAQSAYDDHAAWTVGDKVAYMAGTALFIVPTWLAATWLGAAAGARVPETWSLDFAVPLAFLALVGPMLRTRAHRSAALVSAVGALALSWMPWNLGLIVAAVAAMAVGAELERRA
jgi:predicted branched-subunit amino acid permease